jgi:hypothetical protein
MDAQRQLARAFRIPAGIRAELASEIAQQAAMGAGNEPDGVGKTQEHMKAGATT